jgi:cardiolipin synthase
MNICDDHLVAQPGNAMPTTDLHVALQGPVLAQLYEVFADDWEYASGERWTPPATPTAPAIASPGEPHEVAKRAICRVITDGPNEDYGFLTMVLLSAIAAATRRIVIVTPYFVPPEEILTALLSAALRGVVVDVILSRNVDHRITHWATLHVLPRLLERGVRIWYQPPPFCHTKLIVVDDLYAQFGSANLDARSLKLNFELMVEVYDQGFARQLAMHAEALRFKATRQTADALRRRPLLLRLRDAACWLFSPYL